MNCCDDYGKCTQGPNCPVRKTKVSATQKSFWPIFSFSAFVLVAALILIASFIENRLTNQLPPTSALDHANKYCQALYGPQTGAIFNDTLQCQTVRGEVLPARAP